jgi:exosome complex component RRP42
MEHLSDGEHAYVVAGAAAGIRSDGRRVLERRAVSLETGILPTASGSARARIGGGVTDVLVGVTATIASPRLDAPREGLVNFTVECSSLASPDYTGRGADELNAELSMLLGRLYGSGAAAELRAGLCLIPGKKCWALQVDTLVLDSDGSVGDAASLAVRAALGTALLPSVRVVPGEADDEDEVEVDEGALRPLSGVASAPVAVTLVALGPHGVRVADATSAEARCARAEMTVGVGGGGRAGGTIASGKTGLGVDEVLALLCDARTLGLDALEKVDHFVSEEIERRMREQAFDSVGFFGK